MKAGWRGAARGRQGRAGVAPTAVRGWQSQGEPAMFVCLSYKSEAGIREVGVMWGEAEEVAIRACATYRGCGGDSGWQNV